MSRLGRTLRELPADPRLAGAAWVALCAAVVLGGLAVRLAPAETARAWPWLPPAGAQWPDLSAATRAAALGAALGAGALLMLAAGRVRARGGAADWAVLILVHPLLLAAIWLLLPSEGAGPGTWGAAAAAALLGIVLARRADRPPRPRLATGRRFLAASGLMAAVPVAAGLAAGTAVNLQAVGLSLLLYPAYAWLQLTLFLAVPAPRLRRLGLGPRAAAACCALVFALVHWPNLPVMAVTGLAMFYWAGRYLAGQRRLHLALAMGLAATTFSQFLPDTWTGHLRVGPYAVRSAAVEGLADWAGRRANGVDRLPAAAPCEPRTFVALLYPVITGRAADVAELDAWEAALLAGRRTTMAWQFHLSDAYARRAAREGLPTLDATVLWTELDEVWRRRLEAFGSQEYWTAAGGTLDGFVDRLYCEILGRAGSPAERAAWDARLTRRQRDLVVQELLRRRPELAAGRRARDLELILPN